MSGKFENNKGKKKRSRRTWPLMLVSVVLLAILAVLLLQMPDSKESADRQTEPTETMEPLAETAAATEEIMQQTQPVKQGITVKNGLEIMDIGCYTGIYMEDGTDELVTGVLMLKLVNNGTEEVEYAKINLNFDGQTAEFTATTLRPGATVVLLEKNRMAYDRGIDYAAAEVVCENYALYQEPVSLHEDKIKIQILDGAINVTNISGSDISGRIAIYYKNKAQDVYYGGITYRILLEGGLKADEIRQMMASHFSATGSEVVFVTIAP